MTEEQLKIVADKRKTYRTNSNLKRLNDPDRREFTSFLILSEQLNSKQIENGDLDDEIILVTYANI